MSNSTDLVPPLELCKLIPEGEFADSYFVWAKIDKWVILLRNCVEKNKAYIAEDVIYPAPTLQEIQASMPHCSCRHDHLGWTVVSFYVDGNRPEFESYPATAALKLYLKLNPSDPSAQSAPSDK